MFHKLVLSFIGAILVVQMDISHAQNRTNCKYYIAYAEFDLSVIGTSDIVNTIQEANKLESGNGTLVLSASNACAWQACGNNSVCTPTRDDNRVFECSCQDGYTHEDPSRTKDIISVSCTEGNDGSGFNISDCDPFIPSTDCTACNITCFKLLTEGVLSCREGSTTFATSTSSTEASTTEGSTDTPTDGSSTVYATTEVTEESTTYPEIPTSEVPTGTPTDLTSTDDTTDVTEGSATFATSTSSTEASTTEGSADTPTSPTDRCGAIRIKCNSSSVLERLCRSAMNGVRLIDFPDTPAGYSTTSNSSCGCRTPSAGIPLAFGYCAIDGSWRGITWLISCDDTLETVASQPIETEEDRQKVSAALAILTSDPLRINSSDAVTTIIDALDNITKNAQSLSPTTATSVISTISHVMETPGLDSSNQSGKLLSQLDVAASLVTLLDQNEPFQAVSKNISVLVAKGSYADHTGIGLIMFTKRETSNAGFRSDQFAITSSPAFSGLDVNGRTVKSSIYVSEQLLKPASKTSFYVFGNSNFFTTNDVRKLSAPLHDTIENTRLSSLIVSATVDNEAVNYRQSENLLLYSLPLSSDESEDNASCVFWSEEDVSWNDVGCWQTSRTDDGVDCACNHLTHFAVLLSPSEDIQSEKALQIITIIGCSLSAVSLIILILIYISVPDTRVGRKFQGSFLLLNLSFALLGLNLTLLVSAMPFVATPAYHEETVSSQCVAMAAVLHLFLIASCAWMNCEGVLIFLAVTKPFYVRTRLRDKAVIRCSIAWGWLMPVLFVGLIALISGTSVYRNPYKKDFVVTCWVEPKYILFLAAIPTMIMISINLLFYVIVRFQLCETQGSGLGRSTRPESQNRRIRMNANMVTLMGVTWVFGFFLAEVKYEVATLLFAYVFAILNSLQGFFLLGLFLMRNKDVRHSMSKRISSMCTIGRSCRYVVQRSNQEESTRTGPTTTSFTNIQSTQNPESSLPSGSIGEEIITSM